MSRLDFGLKITWAMKKWLAPFSRDKRELIFQNGTTTTYHTTSPILFFLFGKVVHQRLLGRAERQWSWHNKETPQVLWLTQKSHACRRQYISPWLFNILTNYYQLLTQRNYTKNALPEILTMPRTYYIPPSLSESVVISKPYKHFLNLGPHHPGVKTGPLLWASCIRLFKIISPAAAFHRF